MGRAVLVPTCIVAILFALTLAMYSPAFSQETTDPLQGLTANIEDGPDSGTRADRITIPVEDCQVDADATITVEDIGDNDDNGEPIEETFTTVRNGTDVLATLTAEQSRIVVEVEDKGAVDVNFGTGEDESGEEGTVTGSTGIQCGTGRDADDDDNEDPDDSQYDEKDDPGDVDDPDDVVAGTGDDKPLPKTGGVPLLFGAGALLLSAALIARRVLAA